MQSAFPPFGIWGSLILEISIAPYTITRFLYLFSLFYYTGATADGDKTPSPPIGWYLQKQQPMSGSQYC